MLRETGDEKLLRADERIRERNEERANKRRREATGNEDNAVRGGVNQQEQEEQEEQQDVQQEQKQQQGAQQEQQDAEMETIVGSIEVQKQIIDMTDWRFETAEAMREAMATIKNRKARVVITSTADERQINKAIKCAKEQSKRGLYFVVEAFGDKSEETDEAIQTLTKEEGNHVSQDYSTITKKGEFGWVAANTRIITNSSCIKDNVEKAISSRRGIRTPRNKWLIEAVEKGINQEKD
jgi:hypothetical protein